MVRRYADAIEDHNPWYFERSPFGGPIAHPTIGDKDSLGLIATKFSWPVGMLHVKHDFEFINPARVGKVLRARGKVVGKEIKRGRERIVVEVLTVDEDGLEILLGTSTFSWAASAEETG